MCCQENDLETLGPPLIPWLCLAEAALTGRALHRACDPAARLDPRELSGRPGPRGSVAVLWHRLKSLKPPWQEGD